MYFFVRFWNKLAIRRIVLKKQNCIWDVIYLNTIHGMMTFDKDMDSTSFFISVFLNHYCLLAIKNFIK